MSAPLSSIRSFSEAFKDVKPQLENPKFASSGASIRTNEKGLAETLATLRAFPSSGEVAVGVGGFCTLDLASIRRGVTHILIVDPSKPTEIFWKTVAPLIAASKSRSECLKALQDTIHSAMPIFAGRESDPRMKEKAFRDQISEIAKIYAKSLEEDTSWLCDDERYSHIHSIFSNRQAAFLSLDLRDAKASSQIARVLSDLSLKVDILYLSNVHNFIPFSSFGDYRASLHYLSDPRTLIVDTHDTPYKITPMLSAAYQKDTLQRALSLARRAGLDVDISLTQRVRPRGEKVEDLYPLMTLVKTVPLENVIFMLGLSQGYYERKAMEGAEKRVIQALVKGSLAPDLESLERALVTALYPESYTPTH